MKSLLLHLDLIDLISLYHQSHGTEFSELMIEWEYTVYSLLEAKAEKSFNLSRSSQIMHYNQHPS
jgi:hypothetical protein